MKTEEIYKSVTDEFYLFDNEIKKQLNIICMGQEPVEEIINYFFNKPGKRLRPALVILSARITEIESGTEIVSEDLIKLAVAVELIHTASLIHDDIIDESNIRREQISLNQKFSNKTAVLGGDLLYVQAFTVLREIDNSALLKKLLHTTKKMCYGEIKESKFFSDFNGYIEVIENKTASFMSACCECGAILVEPKIRTFEVLKDYGYNFGMSYQIVDDEIDNDMNFNFNFEACNLAKKYTELALKNINAIKKSKYKDSLIELCKYVLGRKKEEKEPAANF